jgi:hypothetical protein
MAHRDRPSRRSNLDAIGGIADISRRSAQTTYDAIDPGRTQRRDTLVERVKRRAVRLYRGEDHVAMAKASRRYSPSFSAASGRLCGRSPQ